MILLSSWSTRDSRFVLGPFWEATYHMLDLRLQRGIFTELINWMSSQKLPQ